MEITDQLLKDIKANRCILFLGPLIKAFKENDLWLSHTELYCTSIANELRRSSINFDDNALHNPYYLASKFLDGSREKMDVEAEIISRIYNARDAGIYKELAVIPFNTIINFGFDQLMNQALDKAGYEYEFSFFNYRENNDQDFEIDKETSLLYNLFGSLDEPFSVIKSEKQQLEFLRKINTSPGLPDYLLDRIRDDGRGVKSYVFLGFDFNDWPFRFLLDTLDIPKAVNSSIYPKRKGENIAIMAHDFYKDRFGINFIDQSPEDFVNELVSLYETTIQKHEFGFISFDKNDELFLNDFKSFLQTNKMVVNRNINFFDRTMISPDQITSEVANMELKKATVHIMLISSKAIIEPEFQSEVNSSIKRNDVLIFPVIVSLCSWRTVFPTLEARASIILPGKNIVLNTSQKKVSDEDFVNNLEIINSKVR